ncbi:conserved hypothetical protein (plasmid) [Rhodococcus jostii RHA1]|uniref:Uncharacterized protein n=1 Tax=Rhodococcus jostii (strain RHA1) TaxID=101510 RepID=Q0RVI9_RHOJR|nr:hypothetical protein [Rhodococcus jostii]ABH00697.1 conserved hypothetical protein [Rhodococcus jostii RHA1]
MYFRITADSADLVDPQDVTAFHVVCPYGLSGDDLIAAVRRADIGEVLADGEHVMVLVSTIRLMAADRVGPGWSDAFTAMLDYAESKGWTDKDRARVRAHIERN